MSAKIDLLPPGCQAACRVALNQAGANADEWRSAIDRTPVSQRSALGFLLAHMPARDLATLSADFLLQNLDYAFRVRTEVPCSMVVPETVFLNAVLPYCQIAENRDVWRPDFFARFAELARRSASIQDAVQSLNLIVFDQLRVRLHPERCPSDMMSPRESIEAGWASPTSLAILLANACRAVGIPARLVRTRAWSDLTPGHTWVEVWDHGHWHFLSASEQTPYDLTWFNDLARRADSSSAACRIYAASYQRTDLVFPGIQYPDNTPVYAENVTDSYRNIQPTPVGYAPPVSHPRNYVCYRASTPLEINGRLDKPTWECAPWTEYFVDIEGHRKPAPRFLTRAKLLWDQEYLYIGAFLEEPHVWAALTQKNSIIFNDNDFEIFIDPDGDNHNYYEFELNALNTIWELTLERPYRDGGPVHRGDNLPGLKSAVAVQGTLNNPCDTDHGWSIEVAIPWSGLARYCGHSACPPKDGDQWRLNFSRVEWLVEILHGAYRKVPREAHPEDNWVWSPQGAIDMHRPERWGWVQFSSASTGTESFKRDPSWLARELLMEIYYAQRSRLEPAFSLAALGIKTIDHPSLMGPPRVERTDGGWRATLSFKDDRGTIRRLSVLPDSQLVLE
ncbi:MAG TPA: sugar-binding protein [Candidatus Paceibacterota bacterium]|nr:sugar-binding protein [Candidatus Paceibacterota bacterium]